MVKGKIYQLGLIEKVPAIKPTTMYVPRVVIPRYINWRKNNGNWITPVHNQEDCGACVGFATLGTFDAMMKIASQDSSKNPNFSEASLFFDGGGNCQRGWNFQPALSYLVNHGVCTQECYPWGGTKQLCCDTNRTKAKGYTQIQGTTTGNFSAVKEALLKGPLLTGMEVDSDFFDVDSDKIYTPEYGSFVGNHAICVYGFDEDNQCWLVKNSWGEQWGDEGFCRIAYNQCGIGTEFAFFSIDVTGPMPQTGLLIITDAGLRADIMQGTTKIGETETPIPLAPGRYDLVVQKNGYLDYPISTDVVKDSVTQMTITMTKIAPLGDIQVDFNCTLSIAKMTYGNLVGDNVKSLDVNGLNAGDIRMMPTLKYVVLKDGPNAKVFTKGAWITFKLKRPDGSLVPHIPYDIIVSRFSNGWMIRLSGEKSSAHPYTFLVKETATTGEPVSFDEMAELAITSIAVEEGDDEIFFDVER